MCFANGPDACGPVFYGTVGASRTKTLPKPAGGEVRKSSPPMLVTPPIFFTSGLKFLLDGLRAIQHSFFGLQHCFFRLQEGAKSAPRGSPGLSTSGMRFGHRFGPYFGDQNGVKKRCELKMAKSQNSHTVHRICLIFVVPGSNFGSKNGAQNWTPFGDPPGLNSGSLLALKSVLGAPSGRPRADST